MSEIDRAWLRELMSRELSSFREANPRSFEIFERARGSLLDGVPMNWMIRWPGEFPVYVDEAHGARFTLLGRAYLYGLMAGGRAGVGRAIQILKGQIERTMRLLGVATLDELQPRHVTQSSECLHTRTKADQ